MICTVKGFGVANKAEVDVFLELSCFFYDPPNVGNLISGSSVFSKSSLNIWKSSVHVLLKSGWENFEHCFASVWDECNCVVGWTLLGILALLFFGTGVQTDLFQSCGHCWVFQICWHIECSTFTALPIRIWNSSAGIPSLPLVMLLRVNLSGSRWVITLLWLSGSWRSFFFYSSSVYSCHLFSISSAFVRSIPFLSFIEPMFAWNVPLVSLIFLKRSLVFPILLFSSVSFVDHWGRLSYLSLLFFGALHSDGHIFPFLLCL